MKLHYLPGACSMASHIVLEWLGKPYEAIKMSRDELKQPPYLKLNPMGQVPVLEVDDSWAISQNVAVLEYLAELDPSMGLLGDGSARSRAEVRRWLAFVNADVHKSFSPLFGAERMTKDPAAQDELRKGAGIRLAELLAIVDKQLGSAPYLTGPTRTIADAYLFVVTRWAHAMKLDLSSLKNLQAFFERMQADKAVQSVMKAEGI
jgi:glutathione S-transferase